MPPLTNPKVEYNIVDRLKRIDIVMTNQARRVGPNLQEVFTASKTVGGVLFANSFWMTAWRVDRNNIIRKYMIISGFWVAIIFGSKSRIYSCQYTLSSFLNIYIVWTGLISNS